MNNQTIIFGIVVVAIIILFAILKGGKLKSINFGKYISASFSTETSKKREVVLIITKIPENVAYLELQLYIEGKSVYSIKAKDRGGQEVAREVAMPREGNVHYSIEADGVQRLYSSNMELIAGNYHVSGSGDINLTYGDKLIIHQILELRPDGNVFYLVLEKYDDFINGLLPDDLAETEINRLIDEA